MIAVFGAGGFVGKNLVELLVKKDIDFVAVDIVDDPFEGDLDYVRMDVTDKSKVEQFFKENDINAVVHLSASPLNVSFLRPVENAEVNIIGSLNVIKECSDLGIKFVFSSASSVIGLVEWNPVTENHPVCPQTPYAVSKHTIEEYLRVISEGRVSSFEYVCFRFFNVYGKHQKSGLVPTVYERLVNGKLITIFGDGSATRDFVYVDDVCEFLLLVCECNVENGIYNLGTGIGTSVIDVVKLSSEFLGIEPILNYEPKRVGEIDNFFADTHKLERFFNKKPEIKLEDGLRKTFEWLN